MKSPSGRSIKRNRIFTFLSRNLSLKDFLLRAFFFLRSVRMQSLRVFLPFTGIQDLQDRYYVTVARNRDCIVMHRNGFRHAYRLAGLIRGSVLITS